MSFTRNWSNATPVDHSQFKNIPGAVRNVRIDLEDRVNAILEGFVTGETAQGIKLGRLITIGTGAGSTPTGTGANASYDIYARSNTGSAVELYGIDASGNEIQLTHLGKIPLDLSARLANDGWLIARNAADDGNVNIAKVNTADAIEFASHPYGVDTNPTAVKEYTPKGYVDKVVAAVTPVDLATPGTGVTGTLPVANGGTGVATSLTKSGTWTGDGNASRSVAHGLGAAPTMLIIIGNNAGGAEVPKFWVTGASEGQMADGTVNGISCDATNIVMSKGNSYGNVTNTVYYFFASRSN